MSIPNILPSFPNYSVNMCLMVVSTLLWSVVQGSEHQVLAVATAATTEAVETERPRAERKREG